MLHDGDPNETSSVVQAVSGLPRVEDCADPEALRRRAVLPEDPTERQRIAGAAARHSTGSRRWLGRLRTRHRAGGRARGGGTRSRLPAGARPGGAARRSACIRSGGTRRRPRNPCARRSWSRPRAEDDEVAADAAGRARVFKSGIGAPDSAKGSCGSRRPRPSSSGWARARAAWGARSSVIAGRSTGCRATWRSRPNCSSVPSSSGSRRWAETIPTSRRRSTTSGTRTPCSASPIAPGSCSSVPWTATSRPSVRTTRRSRSTSSISRMR